MNLTNDRFTGNSARNLMFVVKKCFSHIVRFSKLDEVYIIVIKVESRLNIFKLDF